MPPTFAIIRNIYVNLRSIKNNRPAIRIGSKRSVITKSPYVLWLCLAILVCAGQLQATMGVVVITQNGVIIGIDSQITNGSNSRLACKLVHGGSFAVLASGKYGLPSGGVSHDFLDEAKQILAKQTTSSVQDAAAAIDSRIRPLLIRYLTDVFKVQPFNYLMKYNHPNYSILEFVVVGMDRHGPSAYRFQYFAPTPQEFRSETKSFGPTSGQVRAIPVPADYMLPYEGNFWNITANQWKETVAQIAGKIVYSIHEGEKAHKGISDPITTAFIDGSGFQFLDKGALSKNS